MAVPAQEFHLGKGFALDILARIMRAKDMEARSQESALATLSGWLYETPGHAVAQLES